jgi:hypothetical protein
MNKGTSGLNGKCLTVAQLRQVLMMLPDEVRLAANRLGNLTVTTVDGREMGYIDFLHEGEFVRAAGFRELASPPDGGWAAKQQGQEMKEHAKREAQRIHSGPRET